jgi:hypothetical protein
MSYGQGTSVINDNVYVSPQILAVIIGIYNGVYSRHEDTSLPGGVIGNINAPTQEYMTTSRVYYDSSNPNSSYYDTYKFINPKNQKEFTSQRDKNATNLQTPLGDLLKSMVIDATYQVDQSKSLLIIDFGQ